MGLVCQATYTMIDKATGLRVKKITPTWYIEFTDSIGRNVRRKAGLTKEQAKDALRKAESDVLCEKNGLPTRSAARIPARELCERFLVSLKTRATEKHWKRVNVYLKEVLTNCRILNVNDILPERIEIYLDSLAKEKKLGAGAVNTRLHCMNAMMNWAVRARLVTYNPLDCVASREKTEK